MFSDQVSGQSIFFTTLIALVLGYMFSERVRNGIDLASSGMRYVSNRAVRGPNLNPTTLTPHEKDRKIEKYAKARVGGLFNEGNTCFANAVIQALASCHPLLDFLDQFKDERNFSSELLQTITHLNQIHTSNHGYSTQRLMSQLSSTKLNRLDQEDAQEFFQLLLATIEKDVKLLQNGDEEATSNDNSTDQVEQAEEERPESNNNESENEKPITRLTPFDGCFSVRVGCLNCGDMEGIRSGIIGSIDVNLGDQQPPYNLSNLLRKYCSMESIEGVECMRCTLLSNLEKINAQIETAKIAKLKEIMQERADETEELLSMKAIDEEKFKKIVTGKKVQGTKTKQTMLSNPTPDVLMVHINRTYYNLRTGMVQKNSAFVPIDMEIDLAPFVVDPELAENFDPSKPMQNVSQETEIKYKLKAVVVHYGTANYGHYITYRKFAGLWWNISDDDTILSTEHEVQHASNVFMLFYERVGASNTPEYPVADLPEPATEDEHEEDPTSESEESQLRSESSSDEAEEGKRNDQRISNLKIVDNEESQPE